MAQSDWLLSMAVSAGIKVPSKECGPVSLYFFFLINIFIDFLLTSFAFILKSRSMHLCITSIVLQHKLLSQFNFFSHNNYENHFVGKTSSKYFS